jgi:hypothetical protein
MQLPRVGWRREWGVAARANEPRRDKCEFRRSRLRLGTAGVRIQTQTGRLGPGKVDKPTESAGPGLSVLTSPLLCAVERYERIRFDDHGDDANPLRLQLSQWNDWRHELSHPFPPLPRQQLTGAEFRNLDHECRPDHALSWNTFPPPRGDQTGRQNADHRRWPAKRGRTSIRAPRRMRVKSVYVHRRSRK